jgi:hypothetical protein
MPNDWQPNPGHENRGVVGTSTVAAAFQAASGAGSCGSTWIADAGCVLTGRRDACRHSGSENIA